jgi:F-type H+-transporting ATPase subunit b
MRRTQPSTRAGAEVLRAAALIALGVASAGPASAAGGIELVPDPDVFVPLLILFIALVFPLDRLLFRPLFRVLEQRDEKIQGARRRADRLAREADEVVERYQAQVRDARVDAERDRKEQVDRALGESTSITGGARAEAETEIERARSEVGAALTEARGGLRAGAEQLGRAAAEQVLGRTLS